MYMGLISPTDSIVSRPARSKYEAYQAGPRSKFAVKKSSSFRFLGMAMVLCAAKRSCSQLEPHRGAPMPKKVGKTSLGTEESLSEDTLEGIRHYVKKDRNHDN